MLTKLTKYEWMATARYMIPLYIVLAFMTIFSKVVLSLFTFNSKLLFIPTSIFTIYIISIITIAITTFLLIIMRFYKNLLTGEGYLMFTLPAKVHDLISSKLIISMLWVVLSILLCIASLLIVIPSTTSIIPGASSFTLSNIMKGFTPDGISIGFFLLFLILVIVFNILTFYTSIAVGQSISSNKIFGSIIAYVCIYTICQVVAGLCLLVGWLFNPNLNDDKLILRLIMSFGIVFESIGIIIFFAFTNYVLKKRLNLE